MLKSEFIKEVSSLIKNKNVRFEVEKELDNHIEDLKSEYLSTTYSENVNEKNIEEKVIQQMGDSATIAKQFSKIYKPQYDWVLNTISLILIAIGIGVSSSIFNSNITSLLNLKSILPIIISIIIGFVLNICNYKIIEKYSFFTFLGTFTITILSKLISQISDFYPLILTLYIISYSGLIRKYKLNIYTVLVALISIISVILLGKLNVILLSFSYILLIIFQKDFKVNTKRLSILISSISFIFCLLIIFSADLAELKINSFTNPELYSQNEGYIYLTKSKLLSTSKFIGQGSLKAEDCIGNLSDDNIFTYIINKFGILPSLILIILFSIYIYRLIINTNKINDKYGKNIFLGCSTLIVSQILLNILNGLNIIPYVNVKLPFITTNTSNLMCNIIILFMLISIYRRKNIVN